MLSRNELKQRVYELNLLPKKGYGRKSTEFFNDVLSGKIKINIPYEKRSIRELKKLAFEKGLPKKGFGKLDKDVYISLLKGDIKLTDIVPVQNQSIHDLRRLAFNSGLEKVGNGKKSKQFYLDYINDMRIKYIIKNGQKQERLQTKNMADGSIKEAQILLDDNEVDIIVIRDKYFKTISSYIRSLITNQSTRFQIGVKCKMYKFEVNDEGAPFIYSTFFTRSITDQIIMKQYSKVEDSITLAFQQISKNIDEYLNRGSGWIIENIEELHIYNLKYNLVRGGSYFEVPQIKGHKAFLNIQNKDDYCFLWSLTAYFHPTEKAHPERTSHYTECISMWNIKDFTFPFSHDDSNICKFERVNYTQLQGKSINIFSLRDAGEMYPLRLSKDPYNSIDLLICQSTGEQPKNHYVLIKDFDAYKLGSKMNVKNKTYCCKRCFLYNTPSFENLLKHNELCKNNEATACELPLKDKNDTLKFTSFNKMLPVDFIIVYDFESSFRNVEQVTEVDNEQTTVRINQHIPNSCYLRTICFTDPSYNNEKLIKDFQTTSACGSTNETNLIELVCHYFLNEADRVKDIIKSIAPMKLTDADWRLYNSTHVCHICRKDIDLTDKKNCKVRDHCHITGKFRGPAHNSCNLNYKSKGFIPCIAHNSKKYDTKFFISYLSKCMYDYYKLECIPNNEENYISFSLRLDPNHKEYHYNSSTDETYEKTLKYDCIQELRFLDSYAFLASSLDKLASNLPDDALINLCQGLNIEIGSDKFKVARNKGLYPYEWINGDIISKMAITSLPPIECFNNKLNGGKIGNNPEFISSVSIKEYEYAKNAWEVFGCRTFEDYHTLYLKMDVLLLCDIIQNFRELCLKSYRLDPMNYYTLPGFSWDALLLHSDIKLGLLTDIDMYQFVEAGTRGGLSMIKHRYAKAQQLSDGNKRILKYWDANNLYGWAMSQYLPTGGHQWSDDSIETVLSTSSNSNKGYLCEVDLKIPHHLHDKFREYPLCPEHLIIKNEDLSPYQKWFNQKDDTVKKLCLTLHDKKNYIIHYENLKQVVSLGYEITKVHRILEFKQDPWMKSYIDKNTEFRKVAKNDFEKDFFKLMNNAVFGKTMENVRGRINFHLTNNPVEITKLASRLTYKSHTVFDYNGKEDTGLFGIHLHKTKVILNKPIFVGQAILDLSKVLMYDFHYNFIHKHFEGQYKLLFTDTDSLCYSIDCTIDRYNQICKDNIDRFDNNEYSKDHPLYNADNKKVIGKFKDECGSNEMSEFVGLRSKLYSFEIEGEKYSHNKCKGVKQCVSKQMKLDMYKECLFSKTPLSVKLRTFRSYKHKIFTIESEKVALSAFDNKNWICDDGITTIPFGYCTN